MTLAVLMFSVQFCWRLHFAPRVKVQNGPQLSIYQPKAWTVCLVNTLKGVMQPWITTLRNGDRRWQRMEECVLTLERCGTKQQSMNNKDSFIQIKLHCKISAFLCARSWMKESTLCRIIDSDMWTWRRCWEREAVSFKYVDVWNVQLVVRHSDVCMKSDTNSSGFFVTVSTQLTNHRCELRRLHECMWLSISRYRRGCHREE